MTRLEEFLGSIVTSVNQARVMADIESAKIAQAYASDELLKTFPIPRFRAENIELDIPLAIEEINTKQPKDYQPIKNVEFNSYTYNVLKDFAKVRSFKRNDSVLLKRIIARLSSQLESELKADSAINDSIQRFSKELSSQFFEKITSTKKIEERKKRAISNENDLKSKLTEKLVSSLQSHVAVKEKESLIESAQVIVEASKLKEISPDNVIRVKLKLNEEGMEWHTMENENGDILTKLLPE